MLSFLMLVSCSNSSVNPIKQKPIAIDDPLEGIFDVRVHEEMNVQCWPFSTDLEGQYPVRIEGWDITFAGTTAFYNRDSNTSTIRPHLFGCHFRSDGFQRCRTLKWDVWFLSNDSFMGTVTAYVSSSGGGVVSCVAIYRISGHRIDLANSE